MHEFDRKFYTLFISFVPFWQNESKWNSEEIRTQKADGFFRRLKIICFSNRKCHPYFSSKHRKKELYKSAFAAT